MMKRKFLAVILPIIGCATVVGSGFSAWYFSDTLTGGNKVSNLVSLVTPEGEAGPLSVTPTNDFKGDNTKLVLDQGGFQDTDETKGIMIGKSTDVTTVDKSFIWSATIRYSDSSVTLENLGLAGTAIKFTFDIVIQSGADSAEGLDDYIEVKASEFEKVVQVSDSDPTSSGGYTYDGYFADTGDFTGNVGGATFTGTKYTYTKTYSDDDLIDYGETYNKDWYVCIDFSTDNLINKVFKYKEGQKPTESADYDELAAVANQKIVLITTAELVAASDISA